MKASSVCRALPKFLFPNGVPAGAAAGFQVNNLPYGVFKPKSGGDARIGVALGDKVLDLKAISEKGLLPSNCGLSEKTLNTFMGSGSQAWQEVRHEMQTVLLCDDHGKRLSERCALSEVTHEQSAVEMLLPAQIGDYTDFFASREHAENCGKMFRPGADPLQPNWLHLPVGYHGRASTIVVSGTDVRRPRGQIVSNDRPTEPTFGPEPRLDIELEMACFVGPGNKLGEPIKLENAEEHLFGVVLLNDWSARGIQRWEYVPLGPFLGKSFASTISPWVVPFAALEPYRVATPAQDAPEPLPYLKQAPGSKQSFDIQLEVDLKTQEMAAPETIARSNLKYMYWSLAQQITHHTVNGCRMEPGDMFGTGTISGPDPTMLGSLLELSWSGKNDILLDGGKVKRKFLHDGDTVTLRGFCEGADGSRVGFGDCTGLILPAL
jgi:fumarylacetoacetase|mmetsp:Transcript_43409/g.68744  ORF Transcript_43409/g.68744 Transcript_43409/m.68744 type:complete len:435 (-) Transcript_43409:207-1511(-)|eukprot:CAMPEP_0169082872 /NCGR_PEP_ID=MMETSP1015-20121227/11775_1 /TAXON_ID=342587 /ORGANISM="Karlodinium micrum, Strain CCMP2283" /LENGTH=434 /DNA_ID=CAMNT_0009142755 /DNA_START=51 /DNA_END=1355 /DNA_ORIENTATION=+